MARVRKMGVDYFSHDTDASSRRTLATLEAEFGNDGYALWFKLLEMLGQQRDMFVDFSDDLQWLYFVKKAHVDEARAERILNYLARLGAIDGELWKRHRVIWVQNFVDRLIDVYKKRKQPVPQRPVPKMMVSMDFCTENDSTTGISATEIPEGENTNSVDTVSIGAENLTVDDQKVKGNKGSNVKKFDFCTENDSTTGISATEIPEEQTFLQQKVHKEKQSKVKESKEKKSKVNTTTAAISVPGRKYPDEVYGKAVDEYERYIGKIGTEGFKELILSLVDDVGLDIFKEAVKKAVKASVLKFSYIESAAIGIFNDSQERLKGGKPYGTTQEHTADSTRKGNQSSKNRIGSYC